MPTALPFIVIAAAIAWLAFALLARRILSAPIRRGDPVGQLLYRIIRLYVRLAHRVRAEGITHVPARPDEGASGPLIIVANHTAGIDPLLIQALLPFEVRWVMAADMRLRALDPLWALARIIFIDRRSGEAMALREALRHLRHAGVIGLFPEGHIERPPRLLRPFQEGVGLIIARSKAPVLPVLIDGTPQTRTAWSSLFRTSRATVRFLPVVDYTKENLSADEIASDIQRRFADASGWPVSSLGWRFEDDDWIEQPRVSTPSTASSSPPSRSRTISPLPGPPASGTGPG